MQLQFLIFENFAGAYVHQIAGDFKLLLKLLIIYMKKHLRKSRQTKC